jgi:glycerol-3-phosphate acyltransferase PlsY
MTLSFFLFFALAFFLGAIPNAYLAGRFLKKIDIREYGSGNVGATNVFRVLGKGPGVVVFFLDFLKGALPVVVFVSFQPQPAAHRELFSLLIGLASVLGHMFTPFLGFKGGKGIAAGSGVLCVAFPVLFAVSVAVWVLTFLLCRIVSLSSIIAVFTLVLSALWTHQSPEVLFVFILILGLVLWGHRTNIKKLLQGQEQRWS